MDVVASSERRPFPLLDEKPGLWWLSFLGYFENQSTECTIPHLSHTFSGSPATHIQMPRPSISTGATFLTLSGSANALTALARLSIRSLQTSAPLPPPTTSLPPSSSTTSVPNLPPLLPSTAPSSVPSSTSDALSLIKSQSTPSTGRYILARLHARTYLLHPRDILTLPTLKPLQAPGSTLSLTKILEVGSREYSLRSPAAQAKELKKGLTWKEKKTVEFATIPPEVVRCELTVLEHTKSPMERLLKKKRRKGYKKTIEHKQGWTRLRVGDILLGEGNMVKPEGIQI